jgi:hypothetical protein
LERPLGLARLAVFASLAPLRRRHQRIAWLGRNDVQGLLALVAAGGRHEGSLALQLEQPGGQRSAQHNHRAAAHHPWRDSLA